MKNDKGYRSLVIGEVVQEGDEYYASDMLEWLKCTEQAIGHKVCSNSYDALMIGKPFMDLNFRRRKEEVR